MKRPISNVSMLATALLVLAGCGNNAQEIRAYRIPKEAPPTVQPGAPTPTAVAGVMEWDLPEGWTIAPNPNSMRFATIAAGEGDTQFEVAVTQLGGAGGGITNNINRWRGQVGLEPLSEQALTQTVRAIDARGTRGMFVDLASPVAEGAESEASGMLAAIFVTETHSWFIKGAAPMSTIDAHRDAFLALCESVRFVDPDGGTAPPAGAMASAPSGPSPANDTLAWGELPSTWTADSPARSMAVASFTIREGGSEAALTITPLGGNQDMLANVNRWRRQIGLDPVANASEQGLEPIEVAGDPATLVDIIGPEARTLGVIATRGTTTWFYKLSGPADLVGGERAAFETFVRSIRFDGET